MPLKVRYPVKEEGNTVPYPPLYDEIRENYGFVDLRGRPELVEDIPEAQRSANLRQLLIDLASSGLMTLGCDLGEAKLKSQQLGRRCLAGGYVQVVPLPLAPTDHTRLIPVAKTVETRLQADVGQGNWEVDFALTKTLFKLDSELECHTLWIWFHCFSSTLEKARVERERFLESLSAGFE